MCVGVGRVCCAVLVTTKAERARNFLRRSIARAFQLSFRSYGTRSEPFDSPKCFFVTTSTFPEKTNVLRSFNIYESLGDKIFIKIVCKLLYCTYDDKSVIKMYIFVEYLYLIWQRRWWIYELLIISPVTCTRRICLNKHHSIDIEFYEQSCTSLQTNDWKNSLNIREAAQHK